VLLFLLVGLTFLHSLFAVEMFHVEAEAVEVHFSQCLHGVIASQTGYTLGHFYLGCWGFQRVTVQYVAYYYG
jgi:hypothetical protein